LGQEFAVGRRLSCRLSTYGPALAGIAASLALIRVRLLGAPWARLHERRRRQVMISRSVQLGADPHCLSAPYPASLYRTSTAEYVVPERETPVSRSSGTYSKLRLQPASKRRPRSPPPPPVVIVGSAGAVTACRGDRSVVEASAVLEEADGVAVRVLHGDDLPAAADVLVTAFGPAAADQGRHRPAGSLFDS